MPAARRRGRPCRSSCRARAAARMPAGVLPGAMIKLVVLVFAGIVFALIVAALIVFPLLQIRGFKILRRRQ